MQVEEFDDVLRNRRQVIPCLCVSVRGGGDHWEDHWGQADVFIVAAEIIGDRPTFSL